MHGVCEGRGLVCGYSRKRIGPGNDLITARRNLIRSKFQATCIGASRARPTKASSAVNTSIDSYVSDTSTWGRYILIARQRGI